MKLQKKTIMVLSLAIGALLITSTAFADSMTKTGYEELKDVTKNTASVMANELNNWTTNMSFVLKDNDKVIATQSTINKLDKKNGTTENKGSMTIDGIIVKNEYSYSDEDTVISYDSYSDTYYLTKTEKPAGATNMVYGGAFFTNPFENESAKDMEKIFDAAIGNLKNYVFVTTNEDGSKVFTGSISDAQIPSLINALVSFASKQMFSSNQMNANTVKSEVYSSPDYVNSSSSYVENNIAMPKITGDVFIKNVNGKISVDKDGLLNSVYFYGVLSGKDVDGNLHDLSVEALLKLEDINKTVITKPDLTGKKVIENNENNGQNNSLSSKFEGAYVVDVILDKSEQLIKIGEKKLIIESIKDGKITGSYNETYKTGYESYITDTSNFTFEGTIIDPYNVRVSFTDKAGNTQYANLGFDTVFYKISFWVDSKNTDKYADGQFRRVFQD